MLSEIADKWQFKEIPQPDANQVSYRKRAY